MLRKHFVLLFSVLVLTEAFLPSDFEDWKAFKEEHSKHYGSHADEMKHFHNFVSHKYKIDEHNLHHDNGVASFRMGLNKYSDLSHEEFVRTMNGFILNQNETSDDEEPMLGSSWFGSSEFDLPESVDWRESDAVSEVKDQAHCGACYTFTAISSIESHHFLKTERMLSLSEQNVVDCSKSYGNHGCHGGDPRSTMRYIRDHGTYTENSYPYVGYDNHQRCKLGAIKSNVDVKGFVAIPRGDEQELQKALAIHGPIAVAIDAHHESFHHYKEGIWHEPYCSEDRLTHAVLLVGFGKDEYDREFYILKNSYGKTWGEQGFFRMSRNQNNHCGIATLGLFPLV